MLDPAPELLDELCVRFILSLPATELQYVIHSPFLDLHEYKASCYFTIVM